MARDTKPVVDATPDVALDAIYREHFEFVWCVLRRLGVDDGDLDDAAQDVFVVAHRRLGQFEGRAAVRTWLYSIAIRVASNRRRKHARRDALLVRLPRSIPDDLEELAARGQARAILEALLDRLDEHKRTVFVLAELEELTVPAIADIVGENPRTVYSRLRAARARVADELDRLHPARPVGIDAAILAARPRAPIASDRARRAWAAVVARVGLELTPRMAAAGLGLWAKLAVGGGVVGAVAWIGVAAGRPDASPSVQPAIASPADDRPTVADVPAPIAAPVAAPVAAPAPATVVQPVAAPRDVEPPTTPRPRARATEVDALAQQTAMIDRARALLTEGRTDAALAELDRYASSFAAGALRPEADRVRTLALCKAGRGAEAIAHAAASGLPAPRCAP